MNSNERTVRIASRAAEIMFGPEYIQALQLIYADRKLITEFERSPKAYLVSQGFRIPEQIDVVVHHRGSVGKPARVDFHWQEAADLDEPSDTEGLRIDIHFPNPDSALRGTLIRPEGGCCYCQGGGCCYYARF
jgi:hypothetical protein